MKPKCQEFVEKQRKHIVETHPAIKIPYKQFVKLPIHEQEKTIENLRRIE